MISDNANSIGGKCLREVEERCDQIVEELENVFENQTKEAEAAHEEK